MRLSYASGNKEHENVLIGFNDSNWIGDINNTKLTT
jgi:hypothetical protein